MNNELTLTPRQTILVFNRNDVVSDLNSELRAEYCAGHEMDGAPWIFGLHVGINTIYEVRFSGVEIARFIRRATGLLKRKQALPYAVSDTINEIKFEL